MQRSRTLLLTLSTALALTCAGVAHADKSYILSLTVNAGSSRPGNYAAIVDVDTSGVTGSGNESAPLVIASFNFPLVGAQSCTNIGGTAYFSNGGLTQIAAVCGGAWGFNAGFNCPSQLVGFGVNCSGNWFGSLNAATIVDGGGMYTIKPAVNVGVTGVSANAPPPKGKVACKNLTTKQNVKIDIQAGETDWGCTSAGLVVNPGDKVKITLSVITTAD